MEKHYIPKNLEECFNEINKLWDENAKGLIRKDNEDDFLAKTHNDLGRWIRNNWELWSSSELTNYFNSIGISDADEMSSIILRSYYRNLIGKNIEINSQISENQLFKNAQATPKKENYPKNEKNLEFDKQQYYYLKSSNNPACVHIQTNSKTTKTWIYDLQFGWKHINKDQMNELEKTDWDSREMVLSRIFSE